MGGLTHMVWAHSSPLINTIDGIHAKPASLKLCHHDIRIQLDALLTHFYSRPITNQLLIDR